jgi:hypothetical protein
MASKICRNAARTDKVLALQFIEREEVVQDESSGLFDGRHTYRRQPVIVSTSRHSAQGKSSEKAQGLKPS